MSVPALVSPIPDELPSRVAELGLVPWSDPEAIAGNFNSVRFLASASGDLFCFRRPLGTVDGDIAAYFAGMHEAAGIGALGGSVRHRSVQEQVDTLRRFADLDVPVPSVVASGPDWMLSTRVAGKPVSQLMPEADEGESCRLFELLLRGVLTVHRAGEQLWDRWGGNELVDGDEVSFIDFDWEVAFPPETAASARNSFDVCVVVKSAMFFSAHKRAVLDCARRWFSQPDVGGVYDVGILARAFRGQVGAYDWRRHTHPGHPNAFDVTRDMRQAMLDFARSLDPNGPVDPAYETP